jgi:hypothetical protein
MVHIVHVDRALSKEPPAKGSRWPSGPARTTGTGDDARRFPKSRQATSDGSAAVTCCTAAG